MGHFLQRGGDVRSRHHLFAGRPEGDAEEPQLGARPLGAVRNQLEFRPGGGACHLQELKPIDDGADRADQIVTDTRRDQRRQVLRGKVGGILHEATLTDD